MAAHAVNALFFLVSTLTDFLLGALLLRVVLQLARADFYNPLSQLIWKATNPLVMPLQSLLPKSRKLDIAGTVVLFVTAVLVIWLTSTLFGFGAPLYKLPWYALLKVIAVMLNLYTFTLFAQAILSWLGPGVNNPAANVLYSLNEPLLRRVRPYIPTIANLDLSPLVVILALQVLLRLVPLPYNYL